MPDSPKLKKNPNAPKRFRSSFVLFSSSKHKEIRQHADKKMKTTDVAKQVAKEWKELSREDREHWDELARCDKLRYEVEKDMYSGPWKVSKTATRTKDPSAPKRPMSAFLAFSNSRRADYRRRHPGMKNAEISKRLSQVWSSLLPSERKPYTDEEFRLRKIYKAAKTVWDNEKKKREDSVRSKREAEAMTIAMAWDPHGEDAQSNADTSTRAMRSTSPSTASWAMSPMDISVAKTSFSSTGMKTGKAWSPLVQPSSVAEGNAHVLPPHGDASSYGRNASPNTAAAAASPPQPASPKKKRKRKQCTKRSVQKRTSSRKKTSERKCISVQTPRKSSSDVARRSPIMAALSPVDLHATLANSHAASSPFQNGMPMSVCRETAATESHLLQAKDAMLSPYPLMQFAKPTIAPFLRTSRDGSATLDSTSDDAALRPTNLSGNFARSCRSPRGRFFLLNTPDRSQRGMAFASSPNSKVKVHGSGNFGESMHGHRRSPDMYYRFRYQSERVTYRDEPRGYAYPAYYLHNSRHYDVAASSPATPASMCLPHTTTDRTSHQRGYYVPPAMNPPSIQRSNRRMQCTCGSKHGTPISPTDVFGVHEGGMCAPVNTKTEPRSSDVYRRLPLTPLRSDRSETESVSYGSYSSQQAFPEQRRQSQPLAPASQSPNDRHSPSKSPKTSPLLLHHEILSPPRAFASI